MFFISKTWDHRNHMVVISTMAFMELVTMCVNRVRIKLTDYAALQDATAATTVTNYTGNQG